MKLDGQQDERIPVQVGPHQIVYALPAKPVPKPSFLYRVVEAFFGASPFLLLAVYIMVKG